MKKAFILFLATLMVFTLASCGDDTPAQVTDVVKQFGDISMTVPDFFGDVTMNSDQYVCAGTEASITVSQLTEIDILPEEWDEEIADALLEPFYGSVYSDLQLYAFDNNVKFNGNVAVYMSFYGKNDKGIDRFIQVVRLYNNDMTGLYLITFMHSVDHSYFDGTTSVDVINSITLNR